MATQLELLYILKPHKISAEESEPDWFESEFPIRIQLADKIEFLTLAQMEDAAPGAVMGVWRTENPDRLHFVYRAQLPDFDLPKKDDIERVRFRILSRASRNGQEHDIGVAYEIKRSQYEEESTGPITGLNWVALVSPAGSNFRLQHRKQGGGPGGDSPCDALNCHESWAALIKCYQNDCL